MQVGVIATSGITIPYDTGSVISRTLDDRAVGHADILGGIAEKTNAAYAPASHAKDLFLDNFPWRYGEVVSVGLPEYGQSKMVVDHFNGSMVLRGLESGDIYRLSPGGRLVLCCPNRLKDDYEW